MFNPGGAGGVGMGMGPKRRPISNPMGMPEMYAPLEQPIAQPQQPALSFDPNGMANQQQQRPMANPFRRFRL